MDKNFVSVAMCTYNGAQYVQEQLDSIAAQTRLPDELVVCDDKSSDRTIEIIRSFSSKVSFPVRLYINEENFGSLKNKEKAINLCIGDIITLSDWDDVWKPNKLEVILRAFTDNPQAGYVFSNAELVDESLKPMGYTLWEAQGFSSLLKEYSHHDQVGVLLKRNLVWGTTLAFRSSIKNFILPVSLFYKEDGWIALIASCVGSYGVLLSDSLLYYRQHSSQATGGRNTLSQKFKRARDPRDVDFFKKQIQGLEDAKNRLLLIQDTLHKDNKNIPSSLNLIEEKIAHVSQRVFIRSSSNLPLKIKGIITEVLTGKYHQFSNAWQSALKDLWF
jgi:glycosyltransferase involved in cell wall biosynthesis